MTATHELVVPKSIPMIFDISLFSYFIYLLFVLDRLHFCNGLSLSIFMPKTKKLTKWQSVSFLSKNAKSPLAEWENFVPLHLKFSQKTTLSP
jgi:hypothetical protein